MKNWNSTVSSKTTDTSHTTILILFLTKKQNIRKTFKKTFLTGTKILNIKNIKTQTAIQGVPKLKVLHNAIES